MIKSKLNERDSSKNKNVNLSEVLKVNQLQQRVRQFIKPICCVSFIAIKYSIEKLNFSIFEELFSTNHKIKVILLNYFQENF